MRYSRKRASASRSKSAAKSSYLAGFDTEDDGRGNVTLLGFVHERGSFHTRDRGAFLEALEALGEECDARGRQLEAWATNLEYDLVNVFGMDRISEVTLRFGRSYLVSARWRSVEFRDTVRHVPLSVAKLGELVGTPKLRRDSSVRYMIRDATITYRVAVKLKRIYKALGVRPRTTLASTAYHLWAERYAPVTVEPVAEELREAAREAYHGGRTEAFTCGRFEGVTVIDAASMFPWAMVQGAFPVPWGSVERSRAIDPMGVYLVRIRSELESPVLPFRAPEGTIYPNGLWRGWYVGEELIYARELGVKLTVLRGFTWRESCRPFDRYVSQLFRKKNGARGALRLIYKLLLNSLYGKFGQTGRRVVCTPLARWEREGRKHEEEARVWNGLVLYTTDAPAPPWGNYIWAAIVTARARVRLHREIMRARAAGASVLYCDTDSVFYQGGSLRYARQAVKPGDFESRGVFPELLLVGKKEYGICSGSDQWAFHAKGIPQAARADYCLQGRAYFSRPNRLREGIHRGLQPNVWEPRCKRRQSSFDHRARNGLGLFVPLRVREAGGK